MKNFFKKAGSFFLIFCLFLQNIFMVIAPAKALGSVLNVSAASYTWEKIGLDSNDPSVGPNQFLVQARVSVSGEDAFNVYTTATISGSSYVHLVTTDNQNLGNISAGSSKDVFYVVSVDRNAAAYDTSATIFITAHADNATNDVCQRTLDVEKLISQSRNHIVSAVYSKTNPLVGETFTLTIKSETSSGSFPNLTTYPAFNPNILQLLSVNTTYNIGDASELLTNKIWVKNQGNIIESVLTFKALAIGTSQMFYLIIDNSGSSYHYADDYGNVSPITISPNLSLIKSVDKATASPGEELTYTINYQNSGTGAATGVKINDVLNQSGQNYLSYVSGGTWDETTRTVSFDVGTVLPGQTASVSFKVKVNEDLPVGATLIENRASLVSNEMPPINSNSVTTTVLASVKLSLKKSDSPDPVKAGQNIVYTLSYANNGNATATNAVLVDTLPLGVDFVSATSGGIYREDIRTVSWNLGNLRPGQAGSVSLEVKTRADLNHGVVIENNASLTSDQENLNIQESTSIVRPSILIEKQVDKTDASPGEILNYTLRYKVLNVAAENVVISDTVPNHLTNINIQDGGSLDHGVVQWSLGKVEPSINWLELHYSATIEFPLDNGTVIANFATVASDECSAKDSNKVQTTIHSAPILSLDKSDLSDPVEVGQNITYVITFSNTGNMNAYNVSLVDALPTGTVFISASHGGTYSDSTKLITWPIGTLLVGQSLNYELVVKINNDLKDNTVISNGVTLNSDQGSKTDEEQTTAVRPFLIIEKIVDKISAFPSNILNYEIRLKNDGGADAQNVVVSDIADSNLENIQVEDGGSLIGNTITWLVGLVTKGSSWIYLHFSGQIKSPLDNGTVIYNQAVVNAHNNEQVTSNLTETVVTASPNLEIKKISSASTVAPNGEVEYVIKVKNTGNMNTGSFIVTDSWSESVAGFSSYVLDSVNPAATVDQANKTINWNISGLEVGKEINLSYKLHVAPNFTISGNQTITNQACIAGGETLGRTILVERNCSESVLVNVSYGPVLNIQKDSSATVAVNGDIIEYTIIVSNSGTAPAENLKIKDTLPTGFNYKNNTSKLDDVDFPDPQISDSDLFWLIGNVPTATTKTLKFKAEISKGVSSGTKTNLAYTWADNYDQISASKDIAVKKTKSYPPVIQQILGVDTLPETGADLGVSTLFGTIILGLAAFNQFRQRKIR